MTSRRDFLKALLATAAVVVMPAGLKALELENEETPQELKVDDFDVRIDTRYDVYYSTQIYATNGKFDFCMLFDREEDTDDCVEKFMKMLKIAKRRAA